MQEVDVAAGEDDTELWRFAVGSRREHQAETQPGFRSGAIATADDGSMMIFRRSQRRRIADDDLFFGDAKNAGELFAKDRERARRERCAQAVGDGVGGVNRLQRSGGD